MPSESQMMSLAITDHLSALPALTGHSIRVNLMLKPVGGVGSRVCSRELSASPLKDTGFPFATDEPGRDANIRAVSEFNGAACARATGSTSSASKWLLCCVLKIGVGSTGKKCLPSRRCRPLIQGQYKGLSHRQPGCRTKAKHSISCFHHPSTQPAKRLGPLQENFHVHREHNDPQPK